MKVLRVVLAPALVLLAASSAVGQPAGPNLRAWSVHTAIGYDRVWDDEGLLGDGAAVSVAVGRELTDRLTLRGVVNRLPYESDRPWLRIAGRALFLGAEAVVKYGSGSARPFLTAGGGLLLHRDEWLWKQDGEQYERRGSLVAGTVGTGVDIGLSRQLSLAPEVKMYGQLAGATDLDPHVIIQPAVGVVWRWP